MNLIDRLKAHTKTIYDAAGSSREVDYAIDSILDELPKIIELLEGAETLIHRAIYTQEEHIDHCDTEDEYKWLSKLNESEEKL